MAQLKENSSKVTTKSKIALNRLAALVDLPHAEDHTLSWLIISASTKVRVFQYNPVIEDLVIDLSAEKII